MATRFETIDREFVGRVPPQAQDVEMAVLGAMMRDAEAVGLVIEVLEDTDFYKPSHRKIYAAMQSLFEHSEPIDLATVAAELEKSGDLDKCGGRAALVDIADSVFTAANATAHARLVKDKSVLRQLIGVSQVISEACFSAPGEVGDLLDEAESKIFAISESRTRQDFTSVSELTVPTFERIDSYYKSGGGITGLRTGYDQLDALTAGMHPGDLIVLAGRPSMGKTAFALNIMENVAFNEKRACAIFSLEMSKEQLTERLLASVAKVNGLDMRKGRLRKEKYDDLYMAASRLHEANIWIDDTAALSVLELRAKARRLMAQQNLGLIVVDYLQMMHGPRNSENRQQEISVISRSLKTLAKELKVPVLALSQLSRQVEQRGGDRRPQLADLRESGAIEQDADVVMFVYRPERYGITEEKGQSLENTAEIIIGKQRNGPIGTVFLTFLKDFTRFENRADTRTVGQPPPTMRSAPEPPPDDAPY